MPVLRAPAQPRAASSALSAAMVRLRLAGASASEGIVVGGRIGVRLGVQPILLSFPEREGRYGVPGAGARVCRGFVDEDCDAWVWACAVAGASPRPGVDAARAARAGA